jgi:hypothetical protein
MKDFIPYEQALELKELRFDEPCLGYYGENQKLIWKSGYAPWVNSERNLVDNHFASAPLYQQAFRWFRENCDWPIETWIQPYLSINPRTYEGLYWRRGETESVGIYDTYEEAELACLIKLIEIVKTKQP